MEGDSKAITASWKKPIYYKGYPTTVMKSDEYLFLLTESRRQDVTTGENGH